MKYDFLYRTVFADVRFEWLGLILRTSPKLVLKVFIINALVFHTREKRAQALNQSS